MILHLIDIFFQIYMLCLFVRILSSWFPEFQNTQVIRFIAFYTEPYLNLFRRFIPPLGSVDISAILAFLALGFIEQFVKFLVVTLIQ